MIKFDGIKFEPRDIFVGLYWDVIENQLDMEHITPLDHYPYVSYPKTFRLFVLLIPMFPICFRIPLYKEGHHDDPASA